MNEKQDGIYVSRHETQDGIYVFTNEKGGRYSHITCEVWLRNKDNEEQAFIQELEMLSPC